MNNGGFYSRGKKNMLKTGNVEASLKEKKVTTYRMHPNQDLYFGEIMIAPNIPKSYEKMEDYEKRGIVLRLKDLPFVIEHNASIVEDKRGGLWAVPPDYKLEEYQAELREPIKDGQYISRGFETAFRVVKDEPKTSQGFVCDVCGKECESKKALTGHKLGAHKK